MAAAAVGGSLLLLAAQSQLQGRMLTPAVAAALVFGLAAWLVAVSLAPPPTTTVADAAPLRARRPVLATSIGLAALAWLRAGEGVYTLEGVLAWLGAVAAWGWAWWPRGRTRAARASLRASLPWLLPLAGTVLVAAYLRLTGLENLPLEATSDHAEKLTDVSTILGGEHPIFFERNTGREPAQFYVAAGMIEAFGLPLSYATLKLGTAIVGLLAVPAVFLFATELGGRIAGLGAAALMAVNAWALGIDRAGLRFPYTTLATAVTLWLVLRYLRTGDRRCALGAGVALAFGLHGYSAFRVVPLAVPLVMGVALLVARPARRHALRAAGDGALMLATAVVASLPLVRYAVDHPERVFERVASRVGDDRGATSTLAQLLDNLGGAALAFNWRGADIMVNVLRLEPFLDVVAGAALIAGLVVLGARVARGDAVAIALVAAIPVLLLASAGNIAFPLENPNPTRLGPVLPLVFALAGLAVEQLWRVSTLPESRSRIAAAAAAALLAAGFAASLAVNHERYFERFRAQYDRWAPSATEVARVIESSAVPVENAYVVGYPHWVDGRNVAFALGKPAWAATNNLAPGGDLPLPAGRRLLFVLHPDDEAGRAAVLRTSGSGQVRVVPGSLPERELVVVEVP